MKHVNDVLMVLTLIEKEKLYSQSPTLFRASLKELRTWLDRKCPEAKGLCDIIAYRQSLKKIISHLISEIKKLKREQNSEGHKEMNNKNKAGVPAPAS